MVFNVYCDESRHTSDPSDRFAVIGAICCPREKKHELVRAIHELKARYRAQGEIGWSRVSPNKLDFYLAIQKLFLEAPELSFRCILVDRTTLDHEKFSNGDAELGFYKLYYQLLVHWLEPGETYFLYLDWQRNSDKGRFATLREVLARKLRGRARIECLEPVESHTQPLGQLADLLIGAVGYQWNDRNASKAKLVFCEQLAQGLGQQSLKFYTGPAEPKFNIFKWVGAK
ncbi:DUF3800 domain-containing protein [Ferriphaselus sp. R-1]|uniref:DUF3800 domain-containing protein n=1 Tax=Ferriphaselus sp. R-1 TaxID=1485544 RepID=UPI000556C7B8|nr:DUF3800 domain-containing protein [Ferriphaselus sp. R-1]